MKAPKLEVLLQIENGVTITELSHDTEYYDALSETYDFSHPMTSNKPVYL